MRFSPPHPSSHLPLATSHTSQLCYDLGMTLDLHADNLFLSSAELPIFDDKRCAELAQWLIDTDSLAAKALTTPAGVVAGRVGKALAAYGFPIFQLSAAAANIAHAASSQGWLAAHLAPAAQAASFTLSAAFAATLVAIFSARCAKIVAKDSQTYSDALKSGAGHVGSARRLALHLGVEIQARLPNVHKLPIAFTEPFSHCADLLGLQQASAALANFGQQRKLDFDKWRDAAARKASHMVSHGQRTQECYLEALRLLLAERAGLFAQELPASQSSMPPALRQRFDAHIKAKIGSLASLPFSSINTFESKAHQSLQNARMNNASANHSPAPWMPTLAEVMVGLVHAAVSRHGANLKFRWNRSCDQTSGEEFMAWQCALEAQNLAKSLPRSCEQPMPAAKRPATRI